MPEKSVNNQVTEIVYSDGDGVHQDTVTVPQGINGTVGALCEAVVQISAPVVGDALTEIEGNTEYQVLQERIRACSKYKPAKRKKLEYKAKVIRSAQIVGALTSTMANFEVLSLRSEELDP